MKVVGVAGGSGSGKSSVCYALQDALPHLFEVINLDDYQKLKTDPKLPMVENMINWDHPDIIRWDALITDIGRLSNGQPVMIDVWAHRSNTNYETTGQMIPRYINSKPILIIEGYLALHNPDLNRLYDNKYYFELDEQTRNKRRGKANLTGKENYETKVLNPMFKQFVEPTKDAADEVIDVTGKSIEYIRDYLLSKLT